MQPGPIPTLGELQGTTPWIWLWCERCQHHAPLACAVPIIRWGAGISSNRLRQRARCTSCGHKGPKLEIYGDTLFIVVRTAALQDGKIRCGETHIFAGRGYVVTVRHGSTTAYKELRTRCEGAPKMLAMGEGFVVYSIMDFIVDNYFPIMQELETEVDALEDAIFSRTSNQLNIERIYEIRHELLLLRRAVQPLQEMCNRMMRFDVPL